MKLQKVRKISNPNGSGDICSYCFEPMKWHEITCGNCGMVLGQKYIVCSDCGKGYRINETTCPWCQINNKEKQKSKVRKKKKNVTEKEYGTILGLKGKVSISDIHKAYRIKIKENHPDRVANMGKEIKTLAQKRTKEINDAYKYFVNKYKP